MPKFNLRVVLNVPVWAYAEIEADSLDDALDLFEENPDGHILDIDMEGRDTAPGEPEPDFIYAEVKNDKGEWTAAT